MPNEDINEDDLPLLLDERQRRGVSCARSPSSPFRWWRPSSPGCCCVTLLGLAPPDNVPRHGATP
ncbi:hypothetical protein [Candidatus Amarolinea dominans]|uniref:hypothetical protein n=1 Tax=Candidatus Amarolinea dominans TaxID=3140696 RepID=UPI003134D5A5|nr:hypothetical protein [Anaerolineae bacterium]